MARLLKCYGTCGEKYQKEDMVQIKNVNYCRPCHIKKLKDADIRKKLYLFIQTEYKLTFPTGLMLRQIKEFHDTRGYELEDILETLRFLKYNKKETFIIKYGIARVPYFIDEAIAYRERMAALTSQDNKVEERTKILNKKTILFNKNERLDKKIIDMGGILDWVLIKQH